MISRVKQSIMYMKAKGIDSTQFDGMIDSVIDYVLEKADTINKEIEKH